MTLRNVDELDARLTTLEQASLQQLSLLERIFKLLKRELRKETQMSQELDDLVREVKESRSVLDGVSATVDGLNSVTEQAVSFIAELKGKLDQALAGNDRPALEQLAKDLDAQQQDLAAKVAGLEGSKARLANAILANTPAATTPATTELPAGDGGQPSASGEADETVKPPPNPSPVAPSGGTVG